ncbi:MAG: erythromycin esterase family protein [Balneolaceae bacterium]|nr:erythromycin esterase family protein [Balneolaceae bacterium]
MKQVLSSSRQYIEQLKTAGYRDEALFLANAHANTLVPVEQSMTPRDRQMAEKLVHLVESHPGHQIVVWGASSHLVNSLAVIDNMKPDWTYDSAISMGQLVKQQLDEKYFAIAMTACTGTFGAQQIGIEEKRIQKPKPGSLEYYMCENEFDQAAFINLRSLSAREDGAWLQSPLLARPLGYEFMRASWPLVLDGLIVVRKMEPSTPVE